MAEQTDLQFSVGLEEGPDGSSHAHVLTLPGCVASGATRQEALNALPGVLGAWLRFLGSRGEISVPPAGTELEITVDEWIRTDADVASGESDVCFEADLPSLTQPEIEQGLRRFGDLRGVILSRVRRAKDEELESYFTGEWTVRRVLDEMARAEWWTLTRLGASPLAELPTRTVGRLDTAAALIIQHLGHLPEERRDMVLELEGETWTPRKVLRRLLWIEWSMGRMAMRALNAAAETA